MAIDEVDGKATTLVLYVDGRMEYRIVFYATEAGERPMLGFLDSLRGTNEILHKRVTAGLRKLKLRSNHGPPVTAAIHDSASLYELRVGRTDIARVLFFRPGREIVCTHDYVKKSQKLDRGGLDSAERYTSDWERRHPGAHSR